MGIKKLSYTIQYNYTIQLPSYQSSKLQHAHTTAHQWHWAIVSLELVQGPKRVNVSVEAQIGTLCVTLTYPKMRSSAFWRKLWTQHCFSQMDGRFENKNYMEISTCCTVLKFDGYWKYKIYASLPFYNTHLCVRKCWFASCHGLFFSFVTSWGLWNSKGTTLNLSNTLTARTNFSIIHMQAVSLPCCTDARLPDMSHHLID